MGMKVPNEAKLLASLAAVVILGGGGMMALNKLGQAPPVVAPTPAPTTTTEEAFDKFLTSARHSKGEPNAELIIIEFADFECPSCRKAFREALPKILTDYKPRFVFRQFPLEGIHERALASALASEAAAKQGKFWEMYDGLFQSDSANKMADGTPIPALADADILTVARKIGLNVDQFNKDVQDPALHKKIEDEVAFNTQMGVTETPTFLIRGKSGTIDRVTGARQLLEYVAKGGLKRQMASTKTASGATFSAPPPRL